MTENISAYKKFDFNTEVPKLMQSLGSLADQTMVLPVDIIMPPGSASRDHQGPQVGVGAPVVTNQDLVAQNGDFVHQFVFNHYGRQPGDTSQTFAMPGADGKIAGYVTAIKTQEGSADMLGQDNAALMKLWLLYHEVGHALLPGKNVDDNHPYQEAAADAFAALCFLQRFGNDAVPFISAVSWARAHEAMTKAHTNHLTTFALDAIAADAPHLHLSGRTPADLIKLAGAYGRHWTPTISALSDARKFFEQRKNLGYTDLTRACLAAPSALTFYLGGVLLQGFKNGAVLQGQPLNFDQAVWQGLSTAFNKRCAETKLSAAFRRNAPRPAKPMPVAKMMSAPRARGSKPLTVNF